MSSESKAKKVWQSGQNRKFGIVLGIVIFIIQIVFLCAVGNLSVGGGGLAGRLISLYFELIIFFTIAEISY